MAGFLNDLNEDLQRVEANPNYVPDGAYAAFVYESAVKEIKGTDRWVINYKIAPGHGDASGKLVGEMFTLNPKGEKRDQQLSFLKQRLLAFEIPESRFSTFMPDEVQGRAVTVKVSTKDNYTNVRSMQLRDETSNTGPVSAGSGSANSGLVL